MRFAMYKLLRPILFQFDAEAILNKVIGFGRLAMPAAPLWSRLYYFEHPSLETQVFGVKFKNPVGLAPGFDKAGAFASSMAALGFGFVELGSITPMPQPGNEKPRLFLQPTDRSIVNRMGFNSIGMQAVAENLNRFAKRGFVMGVNIGKNKTTSNENALEDYRAGLGALASLADYVVINVSSPNTPGLRELQGKDELQHLLSELQRLNYETPTSPPPHEGEEGRRSRPLLLKISPDLIDAELDDIASVALETGIAGLIATNTLPTREGGMSGRPLAKRSSQIISYLYKKLQGQIPIIGTGGVFSAQDAYEKIRAGASLVEVYTGMVYEGPGVVKKIKKGLVKLVAQDGFKNIQEAVGAYHR